MDVFLSQLDPRQRPKGTRDSLGFEQIWTSYGRKVVVGITTITSSLDNFIVALVGFYLSDKYTDNPKAQANFFMRYEQLIAYMRLETDTKANILGISRAKKNMQENNKYLSIQNQILSSQLSYGLWGLYSTALSDVGLIKNRILIQDGYEIIDIAKEKYPKLLNYIVKQCKDENTSNLNYKHHIESLFELLSNKLIRSKILEALLKKSTLYSYIEKGGELLCDNSSKNLILLTDSIINNNSIDKKLRDDIADIRKIDKVMLVVNKLFNALSHANNDGQNISQFIKHMSVLSLPNNLELPAGSFRNKDLLVEFVANINNKNYLIALKAIFKINENVMKDRNSIPWIEVDDSGKLKIRVKTHSVLTEEEKFDGMAYNYFICSYLNIAKHLKGSL